MISYYGVPINWPDASHFGTLCILDEVEKNTSDEEQMLIKRFGHILELTLELVASNHQLENKNSELNKAISTIKTITGIVPLCAWCHTNIKDKSGEWIRIEEYFEDHTNAHFSHGMCDSCKTTFKKKIPDT